MRGQKRNIITVVITFIRYKNTATKPNAYNDIDSKGTNKQIKDSDVFGSYAVVHSLTVMVKLLYAAMALMAVSRTRDFYYFTIGTDFV